MPGSTDADNASIAKACEREEPAFLELPEGEFLRLTGTESQVHPLHMVLQTSRTSTFARGKSGSRRVCG